MAARIVGVGRVTVSLRKSYRIGVLMAGVLVGRLACKNARENSNDGTPGRRLPHRIDGSPHCTNDRAKDCPLICR
jgi:hypothetical protein